MKRSAEKNSAARSASAYIVMIALLLLLAPASAAIAVPAGRTIVYDGGGAGQVVFDGTLHASKGLSCDECHEAQGLSFALFGMRIEEGATSMRSMELGRSCGRCHQISMSRTLNCSVCHHK